MTLELRDVWQNSVSLTDERGAHILGHPEMRGQEDKLTEILSEPDVVMQLQGNSTVRLFHRSYRQLAIGDNISV